MAAVEKIMYSSAELCQALGVTNRDIDILEQLPDPLPSFSVEGIGRLYPRCAVEQWAARMCDREREK